MRLNDSQLVPTGVLCLLLAAGVGGCGGDEGQPSETGQEQGGSTTQQKQRSPYDGAPPLERSPVHGLVRQAQTLAKAGQLKEAERMLRDARAQAPNQPEVAMLLGQVLVEQAEIELGYVTTDQQLAKAGIELIEGVARSRPDHVPTLLTLGWSYCLTKDHDSARPVLERALELEPGNVVASRSLAGIEHTQGNADRAEVLLAPIIGRGTSDPELLRLWGMVLEDLDRLEESRQAYERAVELAPHDHVALFKLASILSILEREDEADEALARYGDLVARKGEAKTLERQAAAAESPSDLWVRAGVARSGLQDEAAAARNFARAVRANPQNAEALTWLGLTHARQGALQESRGALEEAVRLAPESLDARRILGEVLLAMSLPSDAVVQLEAALKLLPGGLEQDATEEMKRAIEGLLENARASAPGESPSGKSGEQS